MKILAVNMLAGIIVCNNCIKELTCDNCNANLKLVIPCSPITTFVPKSLGDSLDKHCAKFIGCKQCIFKSSKGYCDKTDYVGHITIPKSFAWASLMESKRKNS